MNYGYSWFEEMYRFSMQHYSMGCKDLAVAFWCLTFGGEKASELIGKGK